MREKKRGAGCGLREAAWAAAQSLVALADQQRQAQASKQASRVRQAPCSPCDTCCICSDCSLWRHAHSCTALLTSPAFVVVSTPCCACCKSNNRTHLQGKTVVAVTSGANINFERLRLVSELADLGASTEVMMATSIPERPGAFREFVHTAAGGSGSDLNVTEFKYR